MGKKRADEHDEANTVVASRTFAKAPKTVTLRTDV
jgi:hypothetical protein